MASLLDLTYKTGEKTTPSRHVAIASRGGAFGIIFPNYKSRLCLERSINTARGLYVRGA